MTSNDERTPEDDADEPAEDPDDSAAPSSDRGSVADILGKLNIPVPEVDGGILDAIRDAARVPDGMFKLDASHFLPASAISLGGLGYDKFEIPEMPIDDSKWRTAEASEATAEAAARTAEYTAGLLEAMRRSVELNEETRIENVRARRWSIGIGIASIVVATGSLAAAIVAIGLSGGAAQVTVPEVVVTETAVPETVVTDTPSPETAVTDGPSPEIGVTQVPSPEAD